MDSDIIVQKIIENTKLEKDDIEKKILEKQRELSNLISKEGAAYIIAKELGIELFEKKKRRLEVKNVVPGIRSLNLIARISRIFPAKEFVYKGQTSCVANIYLTDQTGTVRLSLWDDQTHLLDRISVGQAVEIFGAYTKEDGRGLVEIRLSKRGGVKLLEDSDIPVLTDKKEERIGISKFELGGEYEVRAALVQLFETGPFYEMCPTCNKRAKPGEKGFECKEHGVVKPSYMIILSGVIDDGSGNTRVVLFRDSALQMIGMDLEKALSNKDSFFDKIDVLGKEFVFNGTVRKNQMFGRSEFVINSVKEVDFQKESSLIINNLGRK